MGLDIRWPIGLMFTLIGVLLVITGFSGGDSPRLPGVNIDLIWGVVLLIFGVGMLAGAIAGKKQGPPK
jgi:drug/metabolite transporter (DMT)-like permease